MKFKLDECMDIRLITLFSDAGHDAKTVFEEDLSGRPDKKIYSVSIEEKRILITQDMHFSNPFRFPPIPSEGILVIKNPRQLLRDAKYLVRNLISRLREEDPRGRLWIVGHHGIRIWPGE
jgi:hypothetical protein